MTAIPIAQPMLPAKESPKSATAETKSPKVIILNFPYVSACFIQNICNPYAGTAKRPMSTKPL
jgi:hypothetical protein